MLKQDFPPLGNALRSQPPSGGCVLKRVAGVNDSELFHQPPSGGCVLKHQFCLDGCIIKYPAAFGRLCVET